MLESSRVLGQDESELRRATNAASVLTKYADEGGPHMAVESQYTPSGAILNREHSAHKLTVGSPQWRDAVINQLRDGFGTEDIALRLSCRIQPVQYLVADLRKRSLLRGILQ